MKGFIVLALVSALVAVSYASVDCNACDKRDSRASRIACRFLCWLNENDGTKNLSREQITKTFMKMANAKGQVEYAKFNETWKAVAKEFGCEERVKTVFEVFASLSGKDDTSVIGKEDLDALMDLLAGVGISDVTPEKFIDGMIIAIDLLESLVPCP